MGEWRRGSFYNRRDVLVVLGMMAGFYRLVGCVGTAVGVGIGILTVAFGLRDRSAELWFRGQVFPEYISEYKGGEVGKVGIEDKVRSKILSVLATEGQQGSKESGIFLSERDDNTLYYLQLGITYILFLTVMAIFFRLWLWERKRDNFLRVWKLYFFCEGCELSGIKLKKSGLSYSEMEGILFWLVRHDGHWRWVGINSRRMGKRRAFGVFRRDWLEAEVKLVKMKEENEESAEPGGIWVELTLISRTGLKFEDKGLLEREHIRELILRLAERADEIVHCAVLCESLRGGENLLLHYPMLREPY